MKLSTKSRYALEAMVWLAACAPGETANIRQVSEATGISGSYLEQIFFRLRKAGLLAALRGAGGAFTPPGTFPASRPGTSSGPWRTTPPL